ncbi:MAG: minor capsid protein [Bacilli bacterium]|nr:minor capsid protein [Bacilli bacterium]
MNYKLNELDKEILKLRVELEKTSNKELRKILLEQKKYLESLRKDIGSLYMEYGEDLHMTDVEKFNTKRKFEVELKETHRKLTLFEVEIVSSILFSSYINSYYKTANILDKGLSININYKLLRKEFIESVINANFEGQVFSDRIWNNKAWLVNKLYDTIGKGITEGYSVDKMSKEITKIFGSSAYQSKRLINTELARVVTEAQDNIYRDSGVINKVMYNATLDNLTSQICQDLDGEIFDINTNYPKPPQHPNCRSVIIPVVEGWSPRTRRDNITKTNIPYTDYKSWQKENNIS